MAREVMTPRVDVIALPIPVEASDIAKAVRETSHSRFPVYFDDLDNLTGILYVNDLFRAGWQVAVTNSNTESSSAKQLTSLDISKMLRQPLVVPESSHILDVLSTMRLRRYGFAIVVDEYGTVAGVLTIKDLLGQLVGELPDEFDSTDHLQITRVDRHRWLVDGALGVDYVRDKLNIDLPEGEYVTVGGFLFDAFGHIPKEGERLTTAGWELKVVEMNRHRISEILFQYLLDE